MWSGKAGFGKVMRYMVRCCQVRQDTACEVRFVAVRFGTAGQYKVRQGTACEVGLGLVRRD